MKPVARLRGSYLRGSAAVTIAMALALTPTGAPGAQATQTFRMYDYGALGGSTALARSINSSGQVAGSFVARDGLLHAFYSIGRRMVDLGPGDAYAINDLGQVAGSRDFNGQPHAFLYDAVGMHDLGTPSGGNVSIAYDINNHRQVVGQWSGICLRPDGTEFRCVRPFLYEAGGIRDLGGLGGDYAAASAINDLGQVVGYSWTATELDHPFLYDANGMHDMGAVIAAAAGADWRIQGLGDINNKEQVIGSTFPAGGGRGAAFMYDLRTDQFQALDPLVPNDFAVANEINDQGVIVGWARPPEASGTGLTHAVIWDHGVVRDLGTLGGLSSFAYAISSYAVVTGGAETRRGALHVFQLYAQ
jgi:probable HAF family extracellular repeat protein